MVRERSSKFSQQIAFERMINHQQGINQSVYDFCWGMLHISREIDPQPTAHNILQHLISNVKPFLKQIRSDTAQSHPTPADLQQAVTSQPAAAVSNAQKPLSKGQVFENSNNRGSYSNYSGCHICGSLEPYAGNCRERQGFEQWSH
ncbi:unnamed protein product [Didymodactylos carnosus]|uniref:Uncharacterized protein n=1 Tax=Didymodactylos carnosus TaxID=1234261 RepID=A0A8S2DP55_9BILA|nr:unnamed protein product [Didymodactylos carnosus]CAF3740686.1 unnamed protein product [Didymodactylos carnosus]